MDAFEAVVGEERLREGYWLQRLYRVGLTKAEKVEVGRPSCRRWELDIVAYKARTRYRTRGLLEERSRTA